MSSITPDSLRQELDQKAMAVGNYVITATGAVSSTSAMPYLNSVGQLETKPLNADKPLWVDASNIPHAGEFPFAVQLHAGVTDTSYSTLAIKGSSSVSANNIYRQTLVEGSQVTTFGTTKCYARVTVTDSGGNCTDGDYYIELGSVA